MGVAQGRASSIAVGVAQGRASSTAVGVAQGLACFYRIDIPPFTSLNTSA